MITFQSEKKAFTSDFIKVKQVYNNWKKNCREKKQFIIYFKKKNNYSKPYTVIKLLI